MNCTHGSGLWAWYPPSPLVIPIAKVHLRESQEDEAVAFLSSIGQIIDAVAISAKSMEKFHKDTEDVNLTEEEEARAVIQEDRDQVSTVDFRVIANDKNAEIIHLLNDDVSRVNNEEFEECSDHCKELVYHNLVMRVYDQLTN